MIKGGVRRNRGDSDCIDIADAIMLGERMEIHLNVSFPRIPCELLSLDVMDVSGEQQTGVMHGVSKVRLAPLKDGGHVIDVKALDL